MEIIGLLDFSYYKKLLVKSFERNNNYNELQKVPTFAMCFGLE